MKASFVDLVNAMPVPAALVDSDLRFIAVNERLAAVNAAPVEHHLGRRVAEVLPLLPSHVLDAYRETLRSGDVRLHVGPERADSVMRHNDREFRVSCFPATDDAGSPAVLVVIDRPRVEGGEWDTETRLDVSESLIDRAPVGITFFDTDRRFRLVNRALAEMNGLLPAEHIGRTVEEVVPALAEATHATLDEVFENRGPVLHREFSGETAAEPGTPRTWDESWYPVFDARGYLLGAGAIVVETTDFKRAMRRADLLRDLASSLAVAATSQEVAQTTIRLVSEHLVGARGTFMIARDDRRYADIVAWHGYSDGQIARWNPVRGDVPLPVVQCMSTGVPMFIESFESVDAPRAALEFARRAGDRAVVALPLVVRNRCLGALGVAFRDEHRFPAEERTLLETVRAIAAAALERTLRYESERWTSLTLQRSLLPETLPIVDGLQACAEYRPGHGAAVGGDWYELFTVGDKVVIAVGDVAGSGVVAAATMGRLRSMMRGIAQVDPTPSVVLERTQEACAGIADCFATVAIGLYDPNTRVLEVSLAGHAEPIVVAPGGAVTFFGDDARMPPIGAEQKSTARTARCVLESGSVVFLYTDGAYEQRRRDLDVGLRQLADAAALVVAADGPEAFDGVCSRVLDVVLADYEHRDDICLLAVRVA